MLSAMERQNSSNNRPPQQLSYSKPQPPIPRPQQPPHAYSAPAGAPFTGGEGSYAGQPGASGAGAVYNSQSPPPSNYGLSPPPQRYHNRPPVQSKTPPAVAPPVAGADTSLLELFKAVDQNSRILSTFVNGDEGI